MPFIETTAVRKINALHKRLKVIQGGSSAGKTIAILLILIDKAQTQKNKIFSIVSESVPHLKRACIRDFLNIMEAHGYYKENQWNKTDFIYTFETGSKIEFFSADTSDKVRGPRRNGDLFVNECNNISYDTYTQLAIRTEGDIYLDYNPVAEFWYNEEIQNTTDHDFLILTYKDNEGLPEAIVKEIESRQGNKNFWQVFGLGQLGSTESRIYKDWQIIESIPHEARLERYGLDFGYTNDPSALVAVYYYNGGYILDEILFTRGLGNKQIADIILNNKQALVIADSAEPKSIDEIRSYGVNILGVDKTSGSTKNETFVNWSIGLVQNKRISVTKNSTNIIKEYRNYLFITDKNGKITNEPDHTFSHSMDAIRYAFTSFRSSAADDKFNYKLIRNEARQGLNSAK